MPPIEQAKFYLSGKNSKLFINARNKVFKTAIWFAYL